MSLPESETIEAPEGGWTIPEIGSTVPASGQTEVRDEVREDDPMGFEDSEAFGLIGYLATNSELEGATFEVSSPGLSMPVIETAGEPPMFFDSSTGTGTFWNPLPRPWVAPESITGTASGLGSNPVVSIPWKSIDRFGDPSPSRVWSGPAEPIVDISKSTITTQPPSSFITSTPTERPESRRESQPQFVLRSTTATEDEWQTFDLGTVTGTPSAIGRTQVVVNWGDGAQSAAKLLPHGSNTWSIQAGHTFLDSGEFSVSIHSTTATNHSQSYSTSVVVGDSAPFGSAESILPDVGATHQKSGVSFTSLLNGRYPFPVNDWGNPIGGVDDPRPPLPPSTLNPPSPPGPPPPITPNAKNPTLTFLAKSWDEGMYDETTDHPIAEIYDPYQTWGGYATVTWSDGAPGNPYFVALPGQNGQPSNRWHIYDYDAYLRHEGDYQISVSLYGYSNTPPHNLTTNFIKPMPRAP